MKFESDESFAPLKVTYELMHENCITQPYAYAVSLKAQYRMAKDLWLLTNLQILP